MGSIAFVKYLNFSMSTALDIMEDVDEDSPQKDFPISIMKCQPSSKIYCEKTTADLYRLFA